METQILNLNLYYPATLVFVWKLTLHHIFQVFPEALFHQLLLAMVHPDHETRVSAHRIFSVVLVPSSVSPFSKSTSPNQLVKHDIKRTLSRAVSVFSSSAALFDKLKRDKESFREKPQDGSMNRLSHAADNDTSTVKDMPSSRSRRHSFKVPNFSMKRVASLSLKSPMSPKECQNTSAESCSETVFSCGT